MTVGPLVGDLVPDFISRNQFGEPVGSADLAGMTSLLIFYPWAYSSICGGELAQLRSLDEQLTERDVRVLAISCDAMFTLRAYADAERFGFELLTDHWPHGEIARAFGIFSETAGCSLRGTFVLDPGGRVAFRQVNPIGEARDFTTVLAELGDQRAE